MPTDSIVSDTIESVITQLHRNEGYQAVRARLEAVMDDEYDDDFHRPTTAALLTAYDLLTEAGLRLGASFPEAAVFPTELQGIRLQWSNDQRQVRLVIAPDCNVSTYLYHQEGKSYKSVDNPSASDLSYWLNWLVSA